MLKGLYLTLMMGPVVPLPAPRAVLEALTGLSVTVAAGQPSGFELTFSLDRRSPLHTLFLLSGGGGAIPILRVVIVATVNGTPEVLMDGVMTHHNVTGGDASGRTTLTVKGVDLSAVMEYIDFSGIPYPAMPAEARVALIVAKYAMFGMVPLVIPTVFMDVPIPISRIPQHQKSDLEYIQKLADLAGYVFYLEPGPVPLMNLAYWGPEFKIGIPQPALNVDMDVHTNVESMNFSYDTEVKTMPILFIYNELTKIPIPIPVPDISLLNPPLGMVPPIPKRIKQLTGLAKASPLQAAQAGLAEAAQTSEAITASGSLDVLRYGRILKARRLVGVRGAGLAYDGPYFVASVTHRIKKGEYKQDFSLTRNALISLLPRLPV